MKHFISFCRLMVLCLFCSFSMSAFSQGVAIYKKDGTMVKYSYEEIDSIVTYNYGETPSVPDVPVTPPSPSPYEAIDLGLSVKWATFNVGATSPEEYGGYYAWGETEEKEDYSWETYKWCNGSENTMTKYCTNSSYGTVDNKTVLDLEDDVAHVKWGGDWRMPTTEEQRELLNNCTWQSTTLNGVKGYKVTGPNGNNIFLPAAGYRYGTSLDNGGSTGNYWSSTPYENDSDRAYGLYFNINTSYYDWNSYGSRNLGQSVRPVSK